MDEAYLNSLPSGFRFKPTDVELLNYYLKRKVYNQRLRPNKIREVELYNYDPDSLTAISKNKSSNGVVDEWYFFTPRDRKYKNGKRPGRAAGDGYWKATGADKNIKYEGNIVGSKKTLVFYRGRPPKGDKTNWIMHEFVLSNPPARQRNGDGDMRLDEWVLCRLYKKQNAKLKPGTLQHGTDEEQEEAADANIHQKNISPQTETHIQEYHGIPPPQSEQFQANDFNVLPQQTFPMTSYKASDDSTSAGLPHFHGCYNAYDPSASGGDPQFTECYNAYDASASGGDPEFMEYYNAYDASGGDPQFTECYNSYDASASGGDPQFTYNASGGDPQFTECYNSYDASASGGDPQFTYNASGGDPQFIECYNSYDASASGGDPQFTYNASGGDPQFIYNASGGDPQFTYNASGGDPQFTECYNSYDASASGGDPQFTYSASGGDPQFTYNASGGDPQFTECHYSDPRLEHGSTIIPEQAVSAPISSMPPDQLPWMGHDNLNINHQPQQHFPSIGNNFQFSAADKFFLTADIGLPKY